MRLRIDIEVGGNELLDLLRKTPKQVAHLIWQNTTIIETGEPWQKKEELCQSAKQIIERKKR